MKRSDVKPEYKWNLDSIMKRDEWEDAFRRLVEEKDSLAAYAGRLKDRDVLLACLRASSAISLRIENLYVFAKMTQDENTALAEAQSMVGRVQNLAAEISASESFISPEIIASYTEEELIALSKEADFSDYSYVLSELARNRKRVLSDKEERIIARASELANGYHNAFTMFDNADVKFARVRDESGK